LVGGVVGSILLCKALADNGISRIYLNVTDKHSCKECKDNCCNKCNNGDIHDSHRRLTECIVLQGLIEDSANNDKNSCDNNDRCKYHQILTVACGAVDHVRIIGLVIDGISLTKLRIAVEHDACSIYLLVICHVLAVNNYLSSDVIKVIFISNIIYL